MYHFFFFLPLLFLSLQLGLLSLSSSFVTAAARHMRHRSLAQNGTVPCPLDFDVLRRLLQSSRRPKLDVNTHCQYVRQSLRLVESEYLRTTNSFLPPFDSAESCWDSYQALVDEFVPAFDIRRTCGFEPRWIAEGCMNITTRAEFEGINFGSALNDVVSACNQSLGNRSPCASCTTALSSLQASYLTGHTAGNFSDCTAYPSIYAAAFANQFGPTDKGTAECLFSLDFTSPNSNNKRRNIVICVIAIGGGGVLFVILGFFWFARRKQEQLKVKWEIVRSESGWLDSISGSSNVIRFTFDEIKQATRSFCRENIIGRGGYGNVYKGILLDGSEVALKRFKNCSAEGDGTFEHEVEAIASVRHVNLVALRGYCIATTPFEGHQRIIVCDLVKNGSLYDHLFGWSETKLSWPIRQKIALGTARGLAYLHYGVQPSIIHRDIKASNILLDDKYEPKVADFGLAKFSPEGMTHVSTRVAGTKGYVCPEYALFGQLSKRSDVYSFGVMLLEFLSGKKALMGIDDTQPVLVAE